MVLNGLLVLHGQNLVMDNTPRNADDAAFKLKVASLGSLFFFVMTLFWDSWYSYLIILLYCSCV